MNINTSRFPVSRHTLSLANAPRPIVAPKTAAHPPRASRRALSVALALAIATSALSLTPGSAATTLSYLRDIETSLGNFFGAGLLDFVVADTTIERTITATTTPIVIPVMTPEAGSFPTMYRVTAEQTGGSTALCNALDAIATTSPFTYSGDLLSLAVTATTTTGSWNLGLTLSTTTGFINGDTCNVDLIYRGWHPQSPEYTGFTDEERVHLIIHYLATADDQDIVLNEFLPNPDASANGMNLGNDASNMPLGEWVELFNNGDFPVNVENWYIADESGGAGNTQAIITAANTFPATTTIPAHGWLVVYFNKPVLNNTGDSIFLYSDDDAEIDTYTYDDPSDFCELEVTPGSTNATSTTSGTPGTDCIDNQVAPNKSYARIPDGTGAFVDPIPTPGAANIPDPEPREEPVPTDPTAPSASESSGENMSEAQGASTEPDPARTPETTDPPAHTLHQGGAPAGASEGSSSADAPPADNSSEGSTFDSASEESSSAEGGVPSKESVPENSTDAESQSEQSQESAETSDDADDGSASAATSETVASSEDSNESTPPVSPEPDPVAEPEPASQDSAAPAETNASPPPPEPTPTETATEESL